MIALTAAEVDRFWSKVEKHGQGCWPWVGELNNQGYGRFTVYRAGRRVRLLAHRVAFTLSRATTPTVVRHDCDNPPCCNPADLRDGTQAQNIQDAIDRGRMNLSGLAAERSDRLARMLAKIEADIKWCSGCDQFKGRGEFHRNRTAPDGLQGECIPCRAERQRNRRAG